MGEMVVRLIGELLVELIGLLTGTLLVALVTLGRVTVQDGESRVRLPWYGVGREESGQPIVSNGFATAVGWAFWLAVIALVVWLVRY